MKLPAAWTLVRDQDVTRMRYRQKSRVVEWGFSRRTLSLRKAHLFLKKKYPNAVCVIPKQVHGRRLLKLNLTGPRKTTQPDACDGLWTTQKDVLLTVKTADCLPVFFMAPKNEVIGIVHAGWRGTQKKLTQHWMRTFVRKTGLSPGALYVYFGPAIRSCCYEVGPEFIRRFPSKVISRSPEGKIYLDLVKANALQLLEAGVPPRRIVDSGICTSCQVKRYFSYRREGSQAGRMVSWILQRPL